MSLHKNSVAIRLSADQIYWSKSFHDPRYGRRVERIKVTQPTEADWAEYRKAKEALEYLRESPYFEDGGPDERSQVNEPEPSRQYIYTETYDEWIARCRELDGEGKK